MESREFQVDSAVAALDSWFLSSTQGKFDQTCVDQAKEAQASGYTISRCELITDLASHRLCENFAVHAGTTITFDGAMSTVNRGDVGVSPGTSITGSYTFAAKTGRDSSIFAASTLTAHDEAMAVPGIPMANEIGGLTFTPGTYRFSAINLAYGTVVILDGLGDPNSTFLKTTGENAPV